MGGGKPEGRQRDGKERQREGNVERRGDIYIYISTVAAHMYPQEIKETQHLSVSFRDISRIPDISAILICIQELNNYG